MFYPPTYILSQGYIISPYMQFCIGNCNREVSTKMNEYKPEGIIIDTEKNKQKMSSVESLYKAYENGDILEARAVICDLEHNLVVDLNVMNGIIPREHGAMGIELGQTKDIAIISRVNKPVCFKIMGFDYDENGKQYAKLSRRLAQTECKQNYLDYLTPGDIISARVTHMEAFGAFVDIGCGISSLIPIDTISVSRINHPKGRFKIRQDIFAIVKSIDEFGRICLSHKELLGTWAENAQLFSSGQTVAGVVRSVEDYGIFVELSPNLAGLAEPKEGVYEGQHASVYIKSIIPEKMKVKLIIVDSFDADYQDFDIKYFMQSDHIFSFKYSPEECTRIVETIFD